MHRSVGMDVNVLLRGMHGFRMFHNFSLVFRHVLRAARSIIRFVFPGIKLYLDQRVAAHRRHLFDHALNRTPYVPRGRPF